jgi:hypothetical protein
MTRRPVPNEPELNLLLSDIASALEYPPTPELTTAVRARITGTSPRRFGFVREVPSPRFGRYRPGLVAAAVIVLGLTLTLVVSPQARRAVADFIGIGGVRIGFGERVPAEPEDPTAKLDLGPRTTLAAAEERVGFDIKLPEMLGLGAHPAGRLSVHVTEPPEGGMVSLFYDDVISGRGDLLITQFEADLEGEFFKKIVFEGAEVRNVRVRRHSGYWIRGAHFFYYFDEFGNQYEETVRLAANVLLWEENGITYRIEGKFGSTLALEIAESLE